MLSCTPLQHIHAARLLVTPGSLTALWFIGSVTSSLQADWALDRREREQQRAKREHFRSMLDEQARCVAPLGLDGTPHAQCHCCTTTARSRTAALAPSFDVQRPLALLQVKAGHTSNAVMTKTEREINADLLRQQTKLAAGK
jgi:hypothetical protein